TTAYQQFLRLSGLLGEQIPYASCTALRIAVSESSSGNSRKNPRSRSLPPVESCTRNCVSTQNTCSSADSKFRYSADITAAEVSSERFGGVGSSTIPVKALNAFI